MNHLFQTPSILIVDDESDIRFLLGNILKQKNIEPVFASTLSEAEQVIEHDPTLAFIFLDNHLPDGLGVNYIKQIKQRCPGCKIVMITAHDNQADREKASSEGADYFIGKPFSRDSIFQALDPALA